MSKTRLEAFSDGVLAISITVMVLELKVPHGESPDALLPLFFSYVLSVVYVGIYWNNHQHMLHSVHHVSGGVPMMAGVVYRTPCPDIQLSAPASLF